MKKLTTKITVAFVIFSASANAQWLPGSWPGMFPDWNTNTSPGGNGCGNSQPALVNPTPWALGGNSTAMPVSNALDLSNVNGSNFNTTSIGTINDAPFILKSNNHESIIIDAGAKVHLGWNNNGGGTAPIDMWSDLSSPNNSRLNFYVDKPGNIESTGNMSLLFQAVAGSAFHVREGNVSSSIPRISALSGGKCGINNASPQAALDIMAPSSPSNFRIYGDASGNVESSTNMQLHFNGTEFQVNSGTVGSNVTRFRINPFGAHIDANGIFNGLFIGPNSSPWYNYTTGSRLWLDAVAADGLNMTVGGGQTGIGMFTSAGAPRFIARILTGGGDDTQFDMRGSAQFGFYLSTNSWEDVNARVNVSPKAMGVKISVNNSQSNVKAFVIENSQITPGTSNTNNPFTVFGDGRTRIGTGFPATGGSAVASGAMLTVDGMILAKDIRVSVASTTHWADYVFAKDYKLTPLNEVEKFVSEHKHLPEVPSEAEVLSDGVDLTAMNVALLKKVEELYLYTIELKKEVEQLKSNSK